MITTSRFKSKIWEYYKNHNRNTLPWRATTNAYHIWVSEVMLQQTQVNRVIPKYQLFMKRFPTVNKLASASLHDVLAVWSGLGYNRRAVFLHTAAQKIVQEHNGTLPYSQEAWTALPGVGANTASAIMAYALNAPVVFIETNIRTVFLHEFFPDQQSITDAQILPLVKQTLDKNNPREWYWALMDYGTMLKQTQVNPGRFSKHYVKQSKFIGSNRQLRGSIIRALLVTPVTAAALSKKLGEPSSKITAALAQLKSEKTVEKHSRTYRLPTHNK